jgi:cytochrome c biogenesis protein CcmG/thiol:disulfide interchange protein DsbE
LGNPYSAIGFDGRGQAALDLGVYGVPETFIINGQGHVVARHVGPLTPEDVRALILPYFMDSPKEAQHAVSR